MAERRMRMENPCASIRKKSVPIRDAGQVQPAQNRAKRRSLPVERRSRVRDHAGSATAELRPELHLDDCLFGDQVSLAFPAGLVAAFDDASDLAFMDKRMTFHAVVAGVADGCRQGAGRHPSAT